VVYITRIIVQNTSIYAQKVTGVYWKYLYNLLKTSGYFQYASLYIQLAARYILKQSKYL